ncbi:ribonuclease H-like domain-containing protein [Tanacetum coccineum]
MVTRAQVGTVNPNPCFHGHTSHIFPLSKSPAIALSDSNWRDMVQSIRHVSFSKEVCNGASGSSNVASCNPTRTSVDTESKLGADGDLVSDPTLYHSLVGGLQYLTFTRPDISYAVQQIRRVALLLGVSTSGYCVFFGDNLLSWSCKRQHTLSRSSAEAEYRGVANVVAETTWLRNLLRELHMPLLSATIVYCDNVSAIYLTANPVQHQRTKHIEIDIHFVRDMVARGHVRVLQVPSRYQYVDIFTKGLPSALFEEFRSSLSVRSSPAPTAEEC